MKLINQVASVLCALTIAFSVQTVLPQNVYALDSVRGMILGEKDAGSEALLGLVTMVSGPLFFYNAVAKQDPAFVPLGLWFTVTGPFLGVYLLDAQEPLLCFERLTPEAQSQLSLQLSHEDFKNYEAERDLLNSLSEQLSFELSNLSDREARMSYALSFWKQNKSMLSLSSQKVLKTLFSSQIIQ